MDNEFEGMLKDAQRIRALCVTLGNVAMHGMHMAKMISYGKLKNLLSGNIFEGTASQENLFLAAEMAACQLEVIHGEQIGPIFDLSEDDKLEIILLARELALKHLDSL